MSFMTTKSVQTNLYQLEINATMCIMYMNTVCVMYIALSTEEDVIRESCEAKKLVI